MYKKVFDKSRHLQAIFIRAGCRLRKMAPRFHTLLFVFLACVGIIAENALGSNEVNDLTATSMNTTENQPLGGTGTRQILTRLQNGLLVYIIPDNRFPLVCTRLYVRAGSANEKPDQAGISHLLEHMVFKGTEHRPKGKIASDVEALGGYLNAATSFDKTWYLTDMPAAHWQTGMDVVKEMAFQATLDPDELEAEKGVVISELQRGEDSPMRKLYENLQVAALRNTPYGRPIIGYEKTINSITVENLREYVSQWYQPQNMMLLVAGDINPASVLEYATALFGDMKNHSDLPVPEPLNLADAASGSPRVEVTRGPWSKIYMGIALPAPGYKDLRSTDLDVLCYLLGGDGTSTFYEKYKYDLQLVDSIDVSNMSLAQAGMVTITAQLEEAKADLFWRDLTADLGRLSAKSFSEDAIARAKFNLEDSMDRAGETLNGLAAWKGMVQLDYGGEQGEENLRFTQRNVDVPQLQTAINTWFDPKQVRVRILAPENAELPDFEGILQTMWPADAAAADKPDKTKGVKPREVVTLDGGCSVILLPDSNAPYISMDFIMAGGNAMLKPDEQGLATLTARLLTDGCAGYSTPAMERWLSERAAAIAARAALQTFSVSLTGPSRFNEDYFSMFKDVLRKPKFEPTELAREVNNMKAALAQRKDQPLAWLFAKLNPFLFPGNQPYGYDSLGDDALLDSFNVVNVRDFWTKQSNQPWVLAVAGDFEREKILEFAKSLPVPHAARFKLNAPAWNDTEKDLTLYLPGKNQAHLMQIFRTVPPTSPDAPGLMLLQSVLSGQSGLLFTQLRDREGLGYTVTAFNRSMPQTGFMAFYIGTTADKLAQATAGFEKIIQALKDTPLKPELLKAGANRLLGDFLRDRQSLASRAGEAAIDAILDYPQDFQKDLIDKAAMVTPEELQGLAKKYLNAPYNVVLMPEAPAEDTSAEKGH